MHPDTDLCPHEFYYAAYTWITFQAAWAFGASGSLPLPTLSTYPESLAHLQVEKGLCPVGFPASQATSASKVCALTALFLPLAAESRVRALSS